MPNLTVARFGHGVGVLGGVVYVAGGKTTDGGNLTTSMEKFDPAAAGSGWVNDAHSLPLLPLSPGVKVGRYFLVMAADEVQGMLWAFGGSNGVQPINNVLFFNGMSPWVESPTFAMPTVRIFHGAGVLRDTNRGLTHIFVVGGSIGSGENRYG